MPIVIVLTTTVLRVFYNKLRRAYFRVVLAKLCSLGNIECDLGDLKVWSAFISFYFPQFLSFVLRLGLYVFYVNFENGTTCVSIWRQTTKGSE